MLDFIVRDVLCTLLVVGLGIGTITVSVIILAPYTGRYDKAYLWVALALITYSCLFNGRPRTTENT
jgi:hypothetical protein